MNRRDFLQSTASLSLLAASDHLFAQPHDWPDRPITMLVPGTPGAANDVLAREFASRLSAALKQTIVVENRTGASGRLGTEPVVRAAPDGYTILFTSASFVAMAPALVKLPYDVQRDLTPIAQTASGGVLLSVSANFPARNLRELVSHVKSNPGKYAYGGIGVGHVGQLIMEWLKKQTGMQTTYVPYRQYSQMLPELGNGVLQIGWSDGTAALPFIESKRIRPIAVSGNVRLPRFPDVPTMGEQGFPFDTVGWFGVFAPAKTPKAIVQRLSDEINRILDTPEVIAKMKTLCVGPPRARTPDQFRNIIADDLRTWKKLAADAGIDVAN